MAGTVVLAMALGMLVLLLWQGTAVAACPHDGYSPSPAAKAPQHLQSAAITDHARQVPAQSQGSGHQEAAHHAVLQPCCGGMACAAMTAVVPGGELVVPVVLARSMPGWPAGPLREGQGVRPDLPPPRLG
ncbi:hypothetical protein FZ983_00855 [Azospirillum sp. B21]|nr:hypothetical protein FZ983_00855 [Azospirillum sp. B21]